MRAAVITAPGHVPQHDTVPDPQPTSEEIVLDVIAAGVHPVVRAIADGRHYASDCRWPHVPGIDGVGKTADGIPVYFSGLRAGQGSIAERVAVPTEGLVPLPVGCDPVRVAALVNPGVSAWLALYHRAGLHVGETVLVLGATGCAGRMAVQLARHGGAAVIVAVGRDRAGLDELLGLGATHTVCLEDDAGSLRAKLADTAADVDVVVDYVWGRTTELALSAILPRRDCPSHRRLRWVQVGDGSGAAVSLPASALRQQHLELTGSGIGSVAPAAIGTAVRQLISSLSDTGLRVTAQPIALAEVENAWARQRSGTRAVVTP